MLAADPPVARRHREIELRTASPFRGSASSRRSSSARVELAFASLNARPGFAALLGRQGAERFLQREDLAASVAEELHARRLEASASRGRGQRSDAARGDVVGGLQVLLERGRIGKHCSE